jgi:SNF2 family DNA or RNA helicase
VIVPLSTLSNWQNEFTKWCPAARTVCYKGTPGQRKEIYKDQVRAGHFNVLLTTYEYIIRDKKFLRRMDWEVVIIDEGHRMKNSQSKFAVTLSSQYTTKFRVLLTGTPLMNDLGELWSLLNYLLPTVRFFCPIGSTARWLCRCLPAFREFTHFYLYQNRFARRFSTRLTLLTSGSVVRLLSSESRKTKKKRRICSLMKKGSLSFIDSTSFCGRLCCVESRAR